MKTLEDFQTLNVIASSFVIFSSLPCDRILNPIFSKITDVGGKAVFEEVLAHSRISRRKLEQFPDLELPGWMWLAIARRLVNQ